jgi:high-affinity nickel-transport protein
MVLIMTVAVVIATKTVRSAKPHLQSYGSVIGATVSGVFLWLIGILNLLVLLDILHIWRQMKRGTYHQERLEELLAQRVRRVLGGRLQNLINHNWQIYPVGLLFRRQNSPSVSGAENKAKERRCL